VITSAVLCRDCRVDTGALMDEEIVAKIRAVLEEYPILGPAKQTGCEWAMERLVCLR
jgi:hypothetical protein